MLTSSRMLQSGTNVKAFLASRPSISCSMNSWILCEVYLKCDVNSTSVRDEVEKRIIVRGFCSVRVMFAVNIIGVSGDW